MFKKAKPTLDQILKDKAELIDQITAHVEAKTKTREMECDRREKALAEARFDIQHLLDLMSDLGHPAVAERMRTRLKQSGAL